MTASRFAVVFVAVAGCLVENPAWDGLVSASGSGDTSADATTGPDPMPSPGCDPLPPPEQGAPLVEVEPGQAAELDELVAAAVPGTTFWLAEGTYDRSGQPPIVITASGTVIRSATGDPEAVILDGGGGLDDLITIRADDVTLAELSVRNTGDDLVAVDPVGTTTIVGTRLHRVHVRDAVNFQLVLEADFAVGSFADDGTVSCSTFALTDEFRAATPDCSSTGAIKGFGASGWTIRDSRFEDMWCPTSGAFIAVHLAYGAANTVVERNLFRDVYRGVMLGFETDMLGARPAPPGSACPTGVQHVGGSIRNNMLWAGGSGLAASSAGVDALISVWSACEIEIQHNTVVSLLPLFSTIEYRFSDTTGAVTNNLLTSPVVARDPAAIVDAGNLGDAGLELFVDPAAGDLHLVPSAAAAIDAAVDVGPTGPLDDFDAQARDATPDVGADEHQP